MANGVSYQVKGLALGVRSKIKGKKYEKEENIYLTNGVSYPKLFIYDE